MNGNGPCNLCVEGLAQGLHIFPQCLYRQVIYLGFQVLDQCNESLDFESGEQSSEIEATVFSAVERAVLTQLEVVTASVLLW